jgi:hypothetical protein
MLEVEGFFFFCQRGFGLFSLMVLVSLTELGVAMA